ncbi:MAG TPA: hypothetical protein VD837_13960 [Terriglobales bacterium]|nr:hypothetical protein [Terriglobales bacterium]
MKYVFVVAKRRMAVAVVRMAVMLCLLSTGVFGLDRDAFTFTAYDLRVRVTPATHGFVAQGKVTLRNDSQVPQRNAALQVSASLAWDGVQLGGKPLTYVTQSYETDIDHTGAVTEAVITFPSEIAPKQTVQLEVSYSGKIVSDATRLTRIGMPEAIALRNDWDRITPEFTGVRGVGYVCWYPVAAEAVSLSEGNRYFDVLGDWKQRNSSAVMKLSIEAVGGRSIAANGLLTGVKASAPIGPEQPIVREAQYAFDPVGFYPPSFAIAEYTTLDRPAITISYLKDHRVAAEEFAAGAERIVPVITEWFGRQREKVQVIELADETAAPFDSGNIVFTPLRTADKAQLELTAAHQLAHASEPPGLGRLWISEGWAQFAQALIRERQTGRQGALNWMGGLEPALRAAEKQAAEAVPAHNNQSRTTAADQPSVAAQRSLPGGQPLIRATDPTYYSIKAMFVWWMLRDMIGDDTLQRVIQSYAPAQDKEPSYIQRLVEAQAKRDLEWFFDDWVYRDRGLPDFSVKTAFARTMLDANVTITITVENAGNASAEVPVFAGVGREEVSERLLVKARSTAVVRVRLGAQPVSAKVNDGSVPESSTENNSYLLPAKAE